MALTHNSYLVLPRLRVQNLNTISSPFTWGAPSITAALGFMHALQRRLPKDWKWMFTSVGMVIHDFEPQVNGAWVKKFNLTRNPLGKGGETQGIIEEGRAHAIVSLVFGVFALGQQVDENQNQQRLGDISSIINTMRFAGGSIIPHDHFSQLPLFFMEGEETNELVWGKIKRSLLPGFALLSRDDLLIKHTQYLQSINANATALDAWLDLSRINRHCVIEIEEKDGRHSEKIKWEIYRAAGEAGWIVPIPVGYSALSERYETGVVNNTRDSRVAFRFVESMCSIGQWVSPHRLFDLTDLLWSSVTDHQLGIYRCVNKNSLQEFN